MKILVAYKSKTGTTEEIARRIGRELTLKGVETEVRDIGTVESLDGYSRLVLGCPVNGMKTLPEFKSFLAAKVANCGLPSDLFIVSYLAEKGRTMWGNAVRKETESVRASIGAESAVIFGGRLKEALPGFARVIFGVPKDLPLDIRDWDKIAAWANELAEKMA